jgi:transketolase
VSQAVRPLPMRDAFLAKLHEKMHHDKSIFFLTADFGSPVLDRIRSDFPDRFCNVGIAEQSLVNVAAGMASEGIKIVAYAIAPFITMRCYEQLRVNLSLLSQVRPLNVTLVGVGAGYSYAMSGPTHQCYEDITLIRALPNFGLYSPADHICAAALVDTSLAQTKPKYLRLDAQVLPLIYTLDTGFHWNQGFEQLSYGSDLCIVSTGYASHTAKAAVAMLASEDIEATHVDLIDMATFSSEALVSVIGRCGAVVTVEEGFRGRGGLDALVRDLLERAAISIPFASVGIEPAYHFAIATREQLHDMAGMSVEHVLRRARVLCASAKN